jgi:hypothetical protein
MKATADAIKLLNTNASIAIEKKDWVGAKSCTGSLQRPTCNGCQ